jgi:hypothetical protein
MCMVGSTIFSWDGVDWMEARADLCYISYELSDRYRGIGYSILTLVCGVGSRCWDFVDITELWEAHIRHDIRIFRAKSTVWHNLSIEIGPIHD